MSDFTFGTAGERRKLTKQSRYGGRGGSTIKGTGEAFHKQLTKRDMATELPAYALQWLIGVGGCAQCNLCVWLQPTQLLLQQPGRILLEVNLPFEFLGLHLKEFMRVAGVAVAACKLTAAVRVDGVSEGKAAPGDRFV